MPRDYAKKNRPSGPATKTSGSPRKNAGSRSSPAHRAPAPVHRQGGGLSVKWIVSLAAVGGFIGFIAYLNSLPDPGQMTRTETVTEKQQVQPPAQTAREEPGFRFYDMLPESEVIPPKVEEYNPGPTEQNFTYLVQSGSFRSQQDAERQRAEIAFQGLRAKVDRIDLDNGSTWFRVNVGPFENRSQMNAAIDKLVGINIQPLVRRIPKNQG